MGVAIGIDSHKSSLAAAAVDGLGRVLAIREVPNDASGHRCLMRWINGRGPSWKVGIEGSGQYGGALARCLIEAGEDVFEVPAFLTGRRRKQRPAAGKSDCGDAVAIARAVAAGDGLVPIRPVPAGDDLRLLVDRRDQLVRERTRAANRIHKHLVVISPGYERSIPRMSRRAHGAAVVRLLRGDHTVRAGIVRALVSDFRRLDAQVAAVTKDIAAAVAASNTTLMQVTGVGVITAAKILGEVGDITRIRSKAAFAMLNATAPIEASSGRVKRHRLNRGGNRQLNHALHMIALSRCRTDEQTRTYRARRLARGDSPREAMRCVKRQLSNVIYRQLRRDLEIQASAP